MATTKKIIGSVPIYRGEYKHDEKYHKQNIVSYLGSAFISLSDENTLVPCIVEEQTFVLQPGWEFLIDNSESYFLKGKDIDLPQSEFDRWKEEGLLNITKNYYTYEE